jgi:hypothetical protein
MTDISSILKLVWPILVLQVGFQIYALVHLFKIKKTKNLSVPVWAIIIIVGEILGPAAYFLVGKADE